MRQKHARSKKFLKALKAIFLNKIPMNLLFLIIIIFVAVVGFQLIKPSNIAETPAGAVVLEAGCPECVCEQKESEPDCSLPVCGTTPPTAEAARALARASSCAA